MRVKICGITRADDAILAAELGAYAVGFVFWPRSPRCVDRAHAREIGAALPDGVLTVGIFVNQPLDEIAACAREARLGAIQLHGDESLDVVRALPLPAIKAVAVRPGFTPADLDAIPDDVTVLLDAHDPVRRGGTGSIIDWTAAADAARRRPVILSGGLHPGNIRAAIARVSPFAVDLSSGVEVSPGVKDHDRLRALFDVIHHA